MHTLHGAIAERLAVGRSGAGGQRHDGVIREICEGYVAKGMR